MIRLLRLILLAAAVSGCGTSSSANRIVAAPLVDLRAKPGTTAQPGIHDPDQETQLLYGERVRVISQEGAWVRVEAPEQPEWSHENRWQGYPGWMKASDLVPFNQLLAPNIVVTDAWAPTYLDAFTQDPTPLRFPMGARLRAIDMGGQLWRVELASGGTVWMMNKSARAMGDLFLLPAARKRQLILAAAEQLIGQPYYWGGRSMKAPGAAHGVLGVDCSGLINLAYRVAGVDIPRDSHEQYLRAKRVASPAPGDLIFLSARNKPELIVHVMLYAGDDDVIEGPGTGLAVRRISLRERLGGPLEHLEHMRPIVVAGQTVYFGSYLNE